MIFIPYGKTWATGGFFEISGMLISPIEPKSLRFRKFVASLWANFLQDPISAR